MLLQCCHTGLVDYINDMGPWYEILMSADRVLNLAMMNFPPWTQVGAPPCRRGGVCAGGGGGAGANGNIVGN